MDHALNPDYFIFLLIFQHKRIFLSTMQTLPFEGHDAKCWWKGLDLSNNACEYEVNRLTNEKVIRGKQNFNANC